MQESNTAAIRDAERLLLRTDALSGAASGISAAMRAGSITPDEVYQLLDVLAADMRATSHHLLAVLGSASLVKAA